MSAFFANPPTWFRVTATILFWLFWIVFLAATLLYFLPWFVAWRRHVRDVGSIFVINLLAGWTLIGYVIAFAMACRTKPQNQEGAR